MNIEGNQNTSEFQEKVNALMQAINEPADEENEGLMAYRMILRGIVEDAIGDIDPCLNTGNA